MFPESRRVVQAGNTTTRNGAVEPNCLFERRLARELGLAERNWGGTAVNRGGSKR
ncbi:MAG: hypothetical protein M3R24_02035 [Chloroflexota bacterium]|nr:hypothetical protein [Chloroflexota bacterium]